MSLFHHIRSIQRPFWFNVDDNDRDMFSFNLEARAMAPVEKWEELLADIFVASGQCTARGTDVFIGGSATIPVGDGPFVSIIDSGGIDGRPAPHNDNFRESLSAQIVVRSKNYKAGRVRALACWRAVDGLVNTPLVAS